MNLRLTIISLFFLSISAFAEEKPIYYIYLAGPEVFLEDPISPGESKKARIKAMSDKQNWPFELRGLYPMDNEIPDFKPDHNTGMRIYEANVALMNQADAVIANMVRFRGPSMDVGTAFEMGYMSGQNKGVFAYYDATPFYGKEENPGLYRERVKKYWALHPKKSDKDRDGIHIENFAMTDNLMMVGAHEATGFPVSASFDEAVMNVAKYFKKEHLEKK